MSKGVTSGATKNATGASTGTKTGSSSTIYLVKATITNNTSGGTSPETINRGKQIKIGAGYNPSDLYYIAEAAPTLIGNAAADDVLSGKTFYSNSYTKHTGSMTNNGSTGGTISTKAGTNNFPCKSITQVICVISKLCLKNTLKFVITPILPLLSCFASNI